MTESSPSSSLISSIALYSTFRFVSMEIEKAPECDLDWLEIFDGGEMSNLTTMGRYCGDSKE